MINRRTWFILALIFAMTRAGFWSTPAALGNSSSSTMVAFSRSGNNSPSFSTWNGSTWSSASGMPSIGGVAYWVILRNCPTRNEMACVTLDNQSDVNVLFHNGSSWGSVTQVCDQAVEAEDRNCDVAYEQSSGDCMIVYYDGNEGNYGYRTYSGGSLSSESDLTMSGITENEIVSLYPRPNSDQIMLVVNVRTSSADPAICTRLWNGSSWGSWSTHETAGTSNDDDCYDFAWETSSGDGLLVYGENGSSSPRYRTWNGSSWSSESSLPSTGGAPWWVRLAADPASDKILYAGLDGNNDINVNAWSGSSWGSNQEVETSSPAYNRRGFDLAFENGGTEALLVYVESGQSALRYRTWNGSSWSSESSGTDLGDQACIIQLQTGTNPGEIFIGASDGGNDIELLRWSGSSMTSKTRIETAFGGSADTEMFAIAVPAGPPVVPADVPYVNDFQGAIGQEWSDTTKVTNSTYTKFLGRHRNNSVLLGLNTTAGTTYTLTFDLYTIDSWDGTPGSDGPDYFRVDVNGSQAFSHTFIHEPSWISDGCSYPFPADQYGDYGYNSSYSDGIFRKVEVVFTASGSVTTLTFSGSLTDESSAGFNDESWGIDNVDVHAALFVDVSSTAGFNVQATTSEQDGAGFHWADLNADGDLDAIVTGGNSSRLMLNNLSGGTFSVSNFGGGAIREQGALADYDNDGDLDFWSCEAGSDGTQRLYTNNGSASFTNAGVSGFSGSGTNEGCAAVDANHDGWPDLVVFSDNGNWIGHNQKSGSVAFSPTTSSTYGLNGSGNYGARGYAASGDINNDGYLDFFYRYNNGRLFVSDGDGTYTQNSRGISVLTGGYEDTASVLADYDNDGDLDLFVPRTTAGYTGSLWRNDVNWTAGTGNFTDVSSSAGLTLNNKPAHSSNAGARSGCFGDYDNDGDLDLFIVGANGNCMLYQNGGDGTFTRTGEGAVISGEGIDAVFVDYDNDGDLDLSVSRLGATAVIFQNQTNNSNYLKVRVVGLGDGATNQFGQGVRVEVWDAAGTTFLGRREIGTARGYGGSEPFWAHFGGLNPATTYKLKIYFNSLPSNSPYEVNVTPSAVSTTLGTTIIPQMYTITEPALNKKILLWSEVRN